MFFADRFSNLLMVLLLEPLNKSAGQFWTACKVMAQTDIFNLFKVYRNVMRKSMVLAPRCSANQPKWCPGALRKRPWEQVRSRTAMARARDNGLEAFRCHLGDFGRHFGTQLCAKGLRGSENRAFCHEIAPKSQKMISSGGF